MQILVLGMHRSGTSMVARILNMMGAYFAPEGISNGANIENPKGFWERRDVRSLNDMLLHSAGANWHRLSGFSISQIPAENLARFKAEAGSLVLNMDAHRPWFLKEPRLSVLAPLWLELLEFPVCVFVHRSPLEVARSLQTRNGFPIPFGLALWERYLTAALDATRDVPRVVVYHRDLFADPHEVVRRLARRMEELGTAGLRIPSEAEILSFIDPSLYRAKESTIKGTLTKAQKDLRTAIETGEAFLSKKPLSFSARSRAILARHEEEEEVRERVTSLEERNRLLLDEMAAVRAAADRDLKIAKTEAAKSAGIATPLVKAFQREMAVLRQELKGGADDVRLLRREQEIVKLRQALVEARARIERDKGEAASARDQIVALRQALVEARARIERDKGEAATAGRESKKLSERLIVYENEIEELRSQGKSSARRILDLNHALARRQSLLASEQAQSEEVRSKNKILKRGLSDLEGLFKQLRDSRSFHFIAYTARRLGLVSRTPRQTTEAIKNQFSAIRKALKEVKSATSSEAAARKGGAGRTAPPPPSRAERSAPGRPLRKDDPALRAEVDRATALRTAASSKHALRMPTTIAFPEPSVCFVVLHHAGAHHLENLFSSFQKTNTYSNVEFNVVLHACVDRSREIIRTHQSRLRIRVTECTDNLSFSCSNNRAVERTAAEYVIFLNNDIIFQEDVITKVLQALQDARTGFVGLRLLYPRDNPDHPGGLQHAGIKFRPDPYFFFQRPFNLGAPEFVADTPKVLESLPAVTGAFLACRRADFLRAGGFCEDYLYGYEDVDISLCFARLLGRRTVAANQLACLHQESATGGFDQPKLIDARRLKNIGHLVRRHGWYLRRKILADKMAGKFFFSENHLEVAFAVTEANSDTKAGDFFSASELAEACREEFGWNIRYLCRNADWYDLSGVDVLVVLLDAYELSQIREAKPDLVKIAWMRNWFERWASRPAFDQYDLFFCSSASSARWLAEHHRKPGWVFPLATNRERFAAGQPQERWKSDYCFTGSYWQFEREIASLLQPERLEPFQFALFGGGWETHPTLQIYARGFVPYVHLPDVYASTRVVIDDANHVTKEWGSLNSRVFDALASGALVITNNKAGAAEVFDGELPVYRSAGELEALLRHYLEKDAERSELVDRLRQKVIAHHTYRQRARALKCVLINRARRSYRIALKIAAPDRDQIHQWGDYHFARSLGKAFAALGHSFRIDCLDEWDRPEAFGDDVVIVLRGLSRYRPKPGQINLMWNISHPNKVQDEEYEEFSHVFVAARLHAAYLSERLQTPVSSLLQCTDPSLFYPDPNPDLPAESLLFVGNSRKQDREAVRFAVRADLPLGIYGSAWSALVPPEFIRGEYIENATLRQHYSQCDILLNDHWPSMRERGFISNRLFDAAAAGAFVITDPVEEAAAVFGEDLVIYRNEEEFRGLIEHYLAHPEERRIRSARVRTRVLDGHTFAHRAEVILAKIKQLDEQERGAVGLRMDRLSDSVLVAEEERSVFSDVSSANAPRTIASPSGPSENNTLVGSLVSQSLLDQRPARQANSACLFIAIKTSVPNLEEAPAWGDHHFALALQRSFERLGHVCRIDMNPDWSREAVNGDNVTLTLRGRHRYRPNSRHLNLMWNISHPDRVVPGEYEDFDHVFIASHSYAEELASKLGARVGALLQCTDPGLFFPEHSADLGIEPLLFVGNSRKEYRRIVRDAIAVGLPVAVYGSLWEEFLPPGHLKGLNIENTFLRRYYSGCKILLNDHWETMAQNGFLSNRLFDAGACAACVISDQAAGMEAVFGDSISTYETPKQLRELVDYYLTDDDARREKGEALRKIVNRGHTFDFRADQIVETIARLLEEREARSKPFSRTPEFRSAEGDSATGKREEIRFDAKGQWSSKRFKFALSQPEKIWNSELAEAHLRGWCFAEDGRTLRAIRLRYWGSCFEGEFGLDRPDVARAFPQYPMALRSGFQLTARMPLLRKTIYLEIQEADGNWIPFFARQVSSWRFHLQPFFAADRWMKQFAVRKRVLGLARRASLFHQIVREELSSVLDLEFWKAMEASETTLQEWPLLRPAGTSLPLVSIIMPTYNRAQLILQAIESVRSQSWSNWELHVCDDGSEDDTEAVVGSVGDKRIQFHKLPHAGAAPARNHGLSRASGRYIAYLDTDNVWHPDYLLTMVGALESEPGSFTAYCKYLDTELDTEGRYRLAAYRDLPFDHEALTAKNFIDLNGFFHRVEVYRELGGFTDRLIRLQDWDLAVRFTFYQDPLYVDHFFVIYRRNAGWNQLTTLHEHRTGPRQIVRENIDRLFLGTPDLGRNHAEPLPVQVIVHAGAIVTDGFGTLVRALARFCRVEVAILGEHPDTDLPTLFGDARLFLSSGELIEVGRSKNVLLVSGSDQEAMRIAAQAWAQSGTPFIVADAEILAKDDRAAQTQATWRGRIWDDRVFRPATRRTPEADLVLLLDDYGLSADEAHQVRNQIEALPGRGIRVILLGAVFSQENARNGSPPGQRPLSFHADAYLLWRPDSQMEPLTSGLPFALALEVPVLTNQDLSQFDPKYGRFSRRVGWLAFDELKRQILALEKDDKSAGRMKIYGRRVFMRKFAASTLGRSLAISCRVAAAGRTRREMMNDAEALLPMNSVA